MDINLIIPVFGDHSDNLESLLAGIESQAFTGRYHVHIAEDIIPKALRDKYKSLDSSRYTFYPNNTGGQLYALRNICRVLDAVKGDSIIGIVDGDDHLTGADCFQKVHDAHEEGFPVVWTANRWDINGLNHSGPLDDMRNVYEHPWVSSHFRTFRLNLYKDLSPVNFTNEDGEFFEKCYDQALMLPLIHLCHLSGGRTKYIPDVHYIYRGRIDHNGESRKLQLTYENFIRSRGYVA